MELFGRHAEAYALTKKKKTAEECAEILVHDYIPRWEGPNTLLSDSGTGFTAELTKIVYDMLEPSKRPTSAYHPQTNGMVERLSRTLCQVLSNLVADGQKYWDKLLLHALQHCGEGNRFGAKPGAYRGIITPGYP